MKYYIGIDGGGTKTDFVLADMQGHIINEISRGTADDYQIGINEMCEMLFNGIRELRNNISKEDIEMISVCLANYGDSSQEDIRIERALREKLSGYTYRIHPDTYNAHIGALLGKSGINVILGTGSIAFGIDDERNTYRSGGWGYFFGGDEASAYWLGCKMLLHFTRQSDGREKRTLLYKYVKDVLSLENDGQIIDLIENYSETRRERISQFAQYLTHLYYAGDDCARQIYENAAGEVAELIIACINKLHFKTKISVTITGGVSSAQDCFQKSLSNNLNDYPVVFKRPMLSPKYGSILLAQIDSNVDCPDFVDTVLSQVKN